MIDIHTHLLPNVDDGSNSEEISIKELFKAQDMGVTDLVLTPHFRMNYRSTPSELKQTFNDFKTKAIDAGVKVNLYLGQEIFVTSRFNKHFSNGDFLTMNDGKYVLLEFNGSNDESASEAVYETKRLGYFPIIAHVERYNNVSIDDIKSLKSEGAIIQVNAGSFFPKFFGKKDTYKKAKAIMENGFCDIVASDVHSFRENRLLDAKLLIEKKYGADVAEKLFEINPKKVL